MKSLKITLCDLRFFARIGLLDQERMVGNEFRVDIAVTVPAEEFMPEKHDAQAEGGMDSDILRNTVNYAEVFELVEETMQHEWLLLESVAVSIGNAIKSRWPSVGGVSVRITKLAPPIQHFTGEASVEYIAD